MEIRRRHERETPLALMLDHFRHLVAGRQGLEGREQALVEVAVAPPTRHRRAAVGEESQERAALAGGAQCRRPTRPA